MEKEIEYYCIVCNGRIYGQMGLMAGRSPIYCRQTGDVTGKLATWERISGYAHYPKCFNRARKVINEGNERGDASN